MADFAPVPPGGKLDQTMLYDIRLVLPPDKLAEIYALSLILAHCHT